VQFPADDLVIRLVRAIPRYQHPRDAQGHFVLKREYVNSFVEFAGEL